MKNISAGSVPPSAQRWMVTERHEHKTLRCGDVVVMAESPHDCWNILIRESDMTLHRLGDEYDQYVHLTPINN